MDCRTNWKTPVRDLNESGTEIWLWLVEAASAHLILWICGRFSTGWAGFVAPIRQKSAIFSFLWLRRGRHAGVRQRGAEKTDP
jgi:hypothetical protein